MKLNFTRALILFAAVAFLYTSCKKAEVKPAAKQTVNYDVLSSRIAMSFMQGITGKIGGTNISDGIQTPKYLTSSIKGPRLFSVNPLCGYTVDTAYNYTQNGDTVKTFAGGFHFVYTCSTANVDGYIVRDSVTNTESNKAFVNHYTLGQHYTVQALDNTYTYVSMDGGLSTSVFDRLLNLAGATYEYHELDATYTLIGVKVKVTNGVADVVTGKATFQMFKSDLDKTTAVDGSIWSMSGTIEFLGDHKAKLTINSNPPKSYMVDLITGVTTPL